jgi:hypothetical protein
VRYELGFYIPEDGFLHSHRRENLKSYIVLTGWALWLRRNVSFVRYEPVFISPKTVFFIVTAVNTSNITRLSDGMDSQRKHGCFAVWSLIKHRDSCNRIWMSFPRISSFYYAVILILTELCIFVTAFVCCMLHRWCVSRVMTTYLSNSQSV